MLSEIRNRLIKKASPTNSSWSRRYVSLKLPNENHWFEWKLSDLDEKLQMMVLGWPRVGWLGWPGEKS